MRETDESARSDLEAARVACPCSPTFFSHLYFFYMGWIRSGKTIHINLLEENVLLHIHSAQSQRTQLNPSNANSSRTQNLTLRSSSNAWCLEPGIRCIVSLSPTPTQTDFTPHSADHQCTSASRQVHIIRPLSDARNAFAFVRISHLMTSDRKGRPIISVRYAFLPLSFSIFFHALRLTRTRERNERF